MQFERTSKPAKRRFDDPELAAQRDRKGKRHKTERGTKAHWEAL